MTSAHVVEATLQLLAAGEGGLAIAMPAPTPSLLLVFEGPDEDARGEIVIGGFISGPPAIGPSEDLAVTIAFWDDLGRIYATPGSSFRLRYAGRIVGSGRVLGFVSDEVGDA